MTKNRRTTTCYSLKEAMQLLREKGLTLKYINREYRVNYAGGTELSAYYTDKLEDAVMAAKHMAECQ